MGVSYKRLWKLLIDKNMKKRDLRDAANLSPSLMSSLNQDKSVTTNTLVRICDVLNCRIEDIMEIVPGETKREKRANIIHTDFNMNKSTEYNVIDLFCGAGGLHIGFENEGCNIKLCIDNNSLVEKTHKRNFPHIPFINRDISLISTDEIKHYCVNDIDIIIGGPPCQGFSTIGNRVSSDPSKRSKSDSRNDLVFAYARIVRDIKPKFIVMENVKGILTMKDGEYLNTVLSELRNAGYNADYRLVNMADYGVPQIRERVIIIGNRIGLSVTFPAATHSDNPEDGLLPWNTCWNVIKDLERLDDNSNFNHVALKHTQTNIERYKLIPEGGRLPEASLPPELYRKNFGNTYKRLNRKRPALTMVPGNDAFPIHPTLHRSLTVREAARIQTFDDNIIFEGNRRQQGHQVGNAVPPMFSKMLANFIKQLLQSAEGS